MPKELRELLDRARRELLDLSTRNRLLSVPVHSQVARVIQVQDASAVEVFRGLVAERKSMGFFAGAKSVARTGSSGTRGRVRSDPTPAEENEPSGEFPDEPVEVPVAESRRAPASQLKTGLTPEALQQRLLALYRDAQTTIEETGVNVLYLALGQLKWFETENPERPLFAPLVLVPVSLIRRNASDRFSLRARDEEVEENLSLRAKLHADFRVDLPEFPEGDVLDLEAYFVAVRQAIVAQPHWEVLPDALTLGFFSFAKFLMYRDLDATTWPEDRSLLQNPFMMALLGEGFPEAEPVLSPSTALDELIPVERLDHVVEADGSQTLAIEMVRQGRSLVIQGPPGTGKSQSIANLIATAVVDGKKVLFVAEKLAALEVVKRRLEREGLGDLCLELHSNKASKLAVLEEIGRTWRLGRPKDCGLTETLGALQDCRSQLNAHAQTLHAVHEPSGLTPFQVLGELVRLGDTGSLVANVDLEGAELWNGRDRRTREDVLADCADRIRQVGIPAHQVWRGVQREGLLPLDVPPLRPRWESTRTHLAAAREAGRALATALKVTEPTTWAEAHQQGVWAEHLARAPMLDRASVGAAIWDGPLAGIRALVEAGQRYAAAVRDVGEHVTASAWEQDFEPVRVALATHGRSLFRFLKGEYRRALAALRAVSRRDLPAGLEARLAWVDTLIVGQRALRELRQGEVLGTTAFGIQWQAERSDWPALEQGIVWVEQVRAAGLGLSFRKLLAQVDSLEAVGAGGVRATTELQRVHTDLTQRIEELQLNPRLAFGLDRPEDVPLAKCEERLESWGQQSDTLSRWSQFAARVREARDLGLGPLVDELWSGALAPADVRTAFRQACFSRLLREFTRQTPELARFDGETHEQRIREFRRLDRERIQLAKFRVLAAHHERMPNMNAGVGAVGIVNSELERKRGHRPVRQLLLDAGSVVQSIKPVFMMSPLSVAQFLAPGAVEFDLLVIDEASQVQPVDALGAIARCRQLVVVGDSRQLPPTRFFARMTGEVPDTEEDFAGAAQVQDIESILGLCSARGMPQAMLRWHYRSRHHSLIAVSNHEFYENQLFIVPSPYAATGELGLQFHLVPHGVFDSGGTGTNRVEAQEVAQAVLQHARRHPNLSLGVAAFSVRQQQAILDEVERLRRDHPETEDFFNGHPNEPFFVKNLENVQGDERDVVFLSIGYGRDAQGALAMRFGPLGNIGGERRLNVLISRAKRRCEVFTSLTAEDIDLERASGRGVRSLKAFLQFARTGRLPATEQERSAVELPLEDSIREALQKEGFDVHPRVGVAGFFVDLAVVDREQPDRYLVGLECDGESYGASRSARDRDRLRQAVLEDHGWILHRVWSTDWFHHPGIQLQRIRKVIEEARTASRERNRRPAEVPPTSEPEILRESVVEYRADPSPLVAEPYETAQGAAPAGREPQEMSAAEMAEVLAPIIALEGPIHEEELVVRIKDRWGFQRVGTRIQESVLRGIRFLVESNRCLLEERCVYLPVQTGRVRNRENASALGVRKPDLLPPVEVRAAILALIDSAHGVGRRESPTAVARLLGFKTTTSQFRSLVERQIEVLENSGQITETKGLLQRGGG